MPASTHIKQGLEFLCNNRADFSRLKIRKACDFIFDTFPGLLICS